jgi:hypothetical protein
MAEFKMPTQWGSGKCQHKEHIYLEGSKTPKKHTVDVWIPEEPSRKGEKKFWVM